MSTGSPPERYWLLVQPQSTARAGAAMYEKSELSLPFGARACMLCIVLGHDGSALSDFSTGSPGAREAVVAEWCAHGENRTERRTIAVRSRACRFGLRSSGLLGHAPCCLDPCPLCSQL